MERIAAMAIMKSLAYAIFLLCLVVATSEAQGLGRAVVARRPGRRDPNEKVFNVLQYGANPGGRKDSALVRFDWLRF